MNATDAMSHHTLQIEAHGIGLDHVLTLVQDRLVISTFPAHQLDAAIDLARVLCRALGQSVDIFRLDRDEAQGVRTGMVAAIGEVAWTHLAHVHVSFLTGVEVEWCDPELQAKTAWPQSAS